LIEIFGSSSHLNACDYEILFISSCVDCALSAAIGYKMEVEASLSQCEREVNKRENTVSEKEAGVSFYAGPVSLDV
jgi:hypothetical protein